MFLTLIIHNCFDISIVSYGILALLGYYIRSLHTPAFAFDYRLLLETPPTEWLKMKDTVFSSHKGSLPLTDKVSNEPETLESHKKIKTDILTKYDPYFCARDGKVLDLRTKEKKKATRYNVKTLCRIQGLNVVLAEIDSDSHISLITQEYFENYVKPLLFPQNYLAEDPPTFKGFGAFLTSKYPPLKLDFQIGGVILSGRFVVTSELHSSPVLIGSDIIHKYGISLIALTNGKWRIQIGYEPQSMVPCIVSYKLNLVSNHLEVKRAILNNVEA